MPLWLFNSSSLFELEPSVRAPVLLVGAIKASARCWKSLSFVCLICLHVAKRKDDHIFPD